MFYGRQKKKNITRIPVAQLTTGGLQGIKYDQEYFLPTLIYSLQRKLFTANNIDLQQLVSKAASINITKFFPVICTKPFRFFSKESYKVGVFRNK